MPLVPHRSKRPTLLIVGCGDVGMRVLRLLRDRYRIVALTTSRERMAGLREAGATPVLGDLDDRSTLARLAALADAVLHLAPPPSRGRVDSRTRHLLQALAGSPRVRRIVYGSTTGVYGDCRGAFIDETWPPRPATDRALRRVDAEAALRQSGRRAAVAAGMGRRARVGRSSPLDGLQRMRPGTRSTAGLRITILRIPGIYALDRSGGDPRERLRRGTPVLTHEDDVYTNHIQADDLARACIAALRHGGTQRVVNVCDDTRMKMGDYFDLAADLSGLPRPARVTAEQRAEHFTPMAMSFMSESRRLHNDRLKRELKFALRYP
ncbi:MAG: NAD(P)-dependent oxidoreductase, partial [Rhizobacter sp.]|nr:NAD(P)-dependent oxidoreductase [Rhizobacter sp.]